MIKCRAGRVSRTRGTAVIEVALMAPWIFFLFAGALDMGFYSYSMIATENAARVAAEYTSKSVSTAADSSSACQYALDEMINLSNVRNLSKCDTSPLVVTATSLTGIDGSAASSVTVTYKTDFLIPIPGVTGQLNITRTVQMRLRS